MNARKDCTGQVHPAEVILGSTRTKEEDGGVPEHIEALHLTGPLKSTTGTLSYRGCSRGPWEQSPKVCVGESIGPCGQVQCSTPSRLRCYGTGGRVWTDVPVPNPSPSRPLVRGARRVP